MTVYEAQNMFLLRERSVFTIISILNVSHTSLLLVYLVISCKKRPKAAFLDFFFYFRADEQGKTRSSFHW